VNAPVHTPGRSARPARGAAACGVAILAMATILGGAALAARPAAAFAKGETVRLAGTVADAQGRPLAGLAVTLTAARSYFSLRSMRSAEGSARTVTARTDAAGRYALDWPWDGFYNSFSLAVGIPVRKGGRDEVEEIESRDVTERLTGAGASGPVDVPFTVANAAYVEKVRRFVGQLASADERRVYDAMGHPDQVKTVRFPDHDEVSWWYFESGKAYRFESGRLAQVVPFDPVKPF